MNFKDTPTPPFSPMTRLAVEAALEAGKLLRQSFGTRFEIFYKPGIQNFATTYDHASEQLLIEMIRAQYPDHSFLAEESGSFDNLDQTVLWIIDPLDGTTNFAHHIPIFTVSIGVVQNGQIISGVIYQPMSEELFVSERGLGAYLNGKRLNVSLTKEFVGGIGATGIPHNAEDNPLHCLDHLLQILKQGTIVRNLGSAALNLAYVAAGCFDAFWAINLYPWDIAAGMLLIDEAGGKMTSYLGEPYSVLSAQPLIATNGLIHEQVLAILRS